MKANDIRNLFKSYFKKYNHQEISSSSLIPDNDPTLLFANAGMNQFKDYFTGNANPENKRAVTIQKCVRAGGKHNDLENVGHTARHHTFFEMLGNFSFGDYFKKDAIKYSWEFLTKELNIPKEKLFITVHNTDDEAEQIWLKIGIDPKHIFRKGDKDNFWEMGQYGPCGPCSEIFYDHGEQYKTPNLIINPGQDILVDESRYVEIWNLVFMQYEKTPEGKFNLPSPSIDTGSGLERLAAVVQGKYWNYDIDIFQKIIAKIEILTNSKYSNSKQTDSIRVIADHIRSATMLITDGVLPSNEGRGYVLRRIIRRAIRHLKLLNINTPTLFKLVPTVLETLNSEYPQNGLNQQLAEKFIKLEETKFLETLGQGLKFLKDVIKSEKLSKNNSVLSGESAFKLYDTYGFPIDLTEIILNESDYSIDIDGFKASMQKQKDKSKQGRKETIAIDNNLFFKLHETFGNTLYIENEELETEASLLAIETSEESSILIFDQTVFYGESGGQNGDKGEVYDGGKLVATIINTLKPVEQLHAHITDNNHKLSINKKYKLKVNREKRNLTARNHSATHLLQSALIATLGEHIKQSGSNVAPDRLRFDFTHPAALTKSELVQVEQLVNQYIGSSTQVNCTIMSKEEAIKNGALAIFGEKYGNEVRVVKMNTLSTELCGGSHVENTSEIGIFHIISESSLSTGIRRIEAVTSTAAANFLNQRSRVLSALEFQLQEKENKVINKVSKLLLDNKNLQKEIKLTQEKSQRESNKTLFQNPEPLNNQYTLKTVEVPLGSNLKNISDDYLDMHSSGVLIAYTKDNEKIKIIIRSPNINNPISCGKIFKELSTTLRCRGGGKDNMAQGSVDESDLASFLTQATKMIKQSIN
jgi:alanyl-tRNA synthetase